MEVALYRGRGAQFVLVHASMRPPRLAEQRHGPLRFLGSIRVDGEQPCASWAAFAGQIRQQAYAVVDESDAFRLMGRAHIGNAPDVP